MPGLVLVAPFLAVVTATLPFLVSLLEPLLFLVPCATIPFLGPFSGTACFRGASWTAAGAGLPALSFLCILLCMHVEQKLLSSSRFQRFAGVGLGLIIADWG